MDNKKLVRGALLIAAALVLQSLRLVLPMPQILSTFIIGTLVHMMLALTLWLNGRTAALLLSLLLPLTAYAQGQLLLPLLIPVVMLGNALFVLLLDLLQQPRMKLLVPPAVKAAAMCAAAWLLLDFVSLPGPAARAAVMFAMSVPQFVTGLAGLLCACRMEPILRKL